MNKETIKKIYIVVFVVFVALLGSFYMLAGDQIKYRESRSDLIVTGADSSTRDLTKGVVIEQRFINLVDRLKTVSFECTTHYRENEGYMTVTLFCNAKVLMKEIINVADIKEGEPVVVVSDEYIEGYTGRELVLQIVADSVPDRSVSVLLNTKDNSGTKLQVNGNSSVGTICFTATGQELIFTGLYYWYIAGGLSVALALILMFSYYRYSRKGHDYIVGAILAINKYEFLISQLVSRDFKTKYKRSVLGVFWSFLNPLLTMTVQFIVFSTLFRNDITNYPVYLLTGIISFSFFNEVTTMCLASITGNANLVKKVYIPKYIFPVSRTLSSSINLSISLIPLLLVSLVTGIRFSRSIVLMLYFLVCLVVFALGIGMFLSATMVFFRDIQFLWSVIAMMWQYATPIFYSPSIIPARFSFILNMNPLYHFIKNARMCLIDGLSPEPRAYALCFVFALGSLLVGSFVFKKTQDQFTLYL